MPDDEPPAKRPKGKLPRLRPSRHVPQDPPQASDTTQSSITTVRAKGSRLTLHERGRSHTDTSTPIPTEEQATPGPSLEASTPTMLTAQDIPEVLTTRKRKRVNTRISKLNEWINLRDKTLDELLRHDGLGAQSQLEPCRHCQQQVGEFRCKDCGHGRTLLCCACLLTRHSELELHRIEKWNGQYFAKTSLSSLGLRVQLGHDGDPCSCPVPAPQHFLVFDMSGVHYMNVDYCACVGNTSDKRTQLLRKRWFPATQTRPQTVATFDLLDTLHELTLQGKGNIYDDYHTILRKTDSANLEPTIYRYPELQRIFRLWRNLMALKRAGRGQDPSGVDGTSPGGLTVECPACPHPGRNLPSDWEQSTSLFLYTLFLAVDANFKLKGKDRKLADVELTPGTSVFVNETEYQEHLANYVDEPEINTCESEHDAIVKASTRSTPGYAVSGCGVVICSRHQLVRKNGAGDLQKGEKYCNMDFVVLSALIGVILHRVFITYDIACQWSKNFAKRMSCFPEEMRLSSQTKVEAAIPRWHITGHGRTCRENFNLQHIPGACQTCGDEIEGGWSHMNPLSASIREMGPAARHDVLNDHWNGWNYRKIVGLRVLLLLAFNEAAVMKEKHKQTFTAFNARFTAEQTTRWTAMVTKWETTRKGKNPYAEPPSGTTLQDVRLQLAKEEAAAKAASRSESELEVKTTLTSFFMTAFDLEDRQFQLRYELSKRKKTETAKQKADFQEKRTALYRHIQTWRQAQLHYTPYAATMILNSSSTGDDGNPRTDTPETIPLFLPSSFPDSIRVQSAMARICNVECRLRLAQADDALSEIRKQRRIIQGLWVFKKINISGTGNRMNTRILTLYNRINFKIERAAQYYRTAYAALLKLDPAGDWTTRLKVLRKEDISGPGKDPDPDEAPDGRLKKKKKIKKVDTNSRREISWIWLAPNASLTEAQTEEEFDESLRAEWAKTRARMMRWQEEYEMVQEEMRRVLDFLEWKASWWETQVDLRKDGSADILQGVVAYARKQAGISRIMAQRFASHWIPGLVKHGVKPDWADKFRVTPQSRVRQQVMPSLDDDIEAEVVDEDENDEICSHFSDDDIDDDFDFTD